MDANTKAVLEGFDELWARVCGAGPAETDTGLGALRGFIADEACAAAFYEAAAGRFPRFAKRLRQLAEEERGHLRRLQAEHFLLTGELLLPPGSCPLPRGGLRALRTAYCDELAAAAAYKSAAEREKSEALAGLYLSNASDEERHAGILKELIFSAL